MKISPFLAILALISLISSIGFADKGDKGDKGDKDLRLIEKKKESVANDTSTSIYSPPLENKWALIVGINNYDSDQINPLKYAVADAKAIYDILTDEKRRGFPKAQTFLITDETEKKPTRNNILEQLKAILDNVEPDDTVLFYFSGHGIEEDKKGYLLPKDTSITIPADTAILLERINELFAKSEAMAQVIILDACHSGVRKDKSVAGRMGKRFAEEIFTGEGRSILSSSDVSEASYEYPEVGHGAYTYYLKEALKGTADFDKNELITVSEAHRYVSSSVKTWATQRGKVQRPRLYQNIEEDIVLTVKPDISLTKIVSSGLPMGTHVFIDDNRDPIKIPFEASPGLHKFRLKRKDFRPIESFETLKLDQVFVLENPEKWIPEPEISWGKAFAASLVIPGLGQHLKKKHLRALFYEVAAFGGGVAVLWTKNRHQTTLDEYQNAQDRLMKTTQSQPELTPEVRDLMARRDDAYNKAKSARRQAIIAQIAVGVMWGINALDAAAIKPPSQEHNIYLEATPTLKGGSFQIRAHF